MFKKALPYLVLAVILSLSAGGYYYAKNSSEISVDFHETAYTGAETCKECHLENYDSWKKTYHRTMTQEANENSVVGNFNGEKHTYWGYTIQPYKKDGKYYFAYYNPQNNELINTLEIKRTVGSRRYQQYLTQTDSTEGNYYRLELLWHIGEKRWVHLNGVFLGSDNQNFDNHTALWNQNCIFCHNTGINPNLINYDEIVQKTKSGSPLNLRQDSRYQSHVSDLGIGCESCHANGEQHIKLNQNPLRRYYLNFTESDDNSIINPEKLSARKSMDICGQCHGQRTPKTLDMARSWMEKGPDFRPGDNLEDHVNPVWQHSKINEQNSDIFKLRFWKDGTPRLSAYEYQGLLQSQCFTEGELTCNDCHSMHDGNPKGMIKKENLTNTPCLKCHQNYASNISKHTKHSDQSDGSLCYNCHMPKMVYGIMEFHRSHKIESPNPAYELFNDKPNACSACHINKTDNWILNKTQQLWGLDNNIKTKEGSSNVIQLIYKLHTGDPAERGIAARNASYSSELISGFDKLFLIPHLLFAMEDSYPAIRRFAFNSLINILDENSVEFASFTLIKDSVSGFDFIENTENRNKILINVWKVYNTIDKTSWPVPPEGSLLSNQYQPEIATILKLRKLSLSQNKQIDIGE